MPTPTANWRLTFADKQLLCALARAYGLSQIAVVRMALRHQAVAAQDEGLLSPTVYVPEDVTAERGHV